MKKRISLFHLIALIALLFSAIPTPVFAAPSGTVTIWYAYGVGGSEEAALNQVIQNAEAAYPGLTIVAVYKDFGTLFSEYETAVRAGGGPDMFIAPNDSLGYQAREGLILDITIELQGKLANVNQSAINGMKVNGLMYGVPESAKAVGLYYNKSKVATPPATTAQLLTMLQGGKKFAAPGIGGPYFFYGFWSAFGGQLMNSAGRCIADQGGFVPAMQYLRNLQAAGATLQTDYETAQTMFLNGDVDMLIGGPWYLKDYETALGTDLGVAAMPAGPAGMAKPMNGIDGYYVNPNTTNLSSVIDLALYMTNQASSQIMTDTGGHIPVRNDVTSSDALVNTFAQISAQATPRPQNPQIDNYWTPFQTMIDNVLAGTTTPQIGVQEACLQMNELNGFVVARTSYSNTTQDGYLLESTETSNLGGTMNSSATTLRLGDDAAKKQYRSILSFDTGASLPDTAVITKVTLKVKRQGIVGGGNPVTMFQGFFLDMRKGTFGTSALQVADWQANANKTFGPYTPALTGGWYTFNLTSAKAYINKLATGSGLTQIRLRFKLDDNNDAIANYLSLYSGNAGAANRPQLIVEYYVP